MNYSGINDSSKKEIVKGDMIQWYPWNEFFIVIRYCEKTNRVRCHKILDGNKNERTQTWIHPSDCLLLDHLDRKQISSNKSFCF